MPSDRKAAVERRRGGERAERPDCEQEDGVTAANQISLSLGWLMSILLCDSHLATPSTMNARSTRFSAASLLLSQLMTEGWRGGVGWGSWVGGGCIGMEPKTKEG